MALSQEQESQHKDAMIAVAGAAGVIAGATLVVLGFVITGTKHYHSIEAAVLFIFTYSLVVVGLSIFWLLRPRQDLRRFTVLVFFITLGLDVLITAFVVVILGE